MANCQTATETIKLCLIPGIKAEKKATDVEAHRFAPVTALVAAPAETAQSCPLFIKQNMSVGSVKCSNCSRSAYVHM